MSMNEYIQPELLILIPVLYTIGMTMKRLERFDDRAIPAALGCIGVVLSLIWTIGSKGFCMESFFVGITQGIVIAGDTVYTNQLIKQAKKVE